MIGKYIPYDELVKEVDAGEPKGLFYTQEGDYWIACDTRYAKPVFRIFEDSLGPEFWMAARRNYLSNTDKGSEANIP